MAYSVHNFESGDVLYAEQLNEMDAQIALNEQNIDAGVSSDMLAQDYSANKTYSVGDYVIYNNELYVCIYEITAPEGWNSAHWQVTNLGDGISDAKNAITELYESSQAPELYDTTSYMGTILNGLCVIADAVIPANVNVANVKIYSSTTAGQKATVVIYGTTTGKAIYVKWFNCIPQWNIVPIDRSFNEPIRIAVYNAVPYYTTTTDAQHTFSYGGLGRLIPQDPKEGDSVTPQKIYSGNFSLSIQWTLTDGVVSELTERVSELEELEPDIVSMYDNVICIGDSLTYSQVYTSATDNRQAFKTYPQVLASLCGCNSYNFASAGDTPVLWWERSSTNAFDNHGLYIVFLGTNGGLTDTIDTDCIGTDPDNFNKTTYTGAYGAILQTIYNQDDTCVIIEPFGTSGDLVTTQLVVKKFSEKYNFPVISIDSEERPNTYYHLWPDGTGENALHFNDLGYAWMANEVRKQIDLLSLEDQFKIMRKQ